MQVAVSTVSDLERRIEISVPAERVSNEFETRLKQVARNARLRGFRPGKAPMPVVRQQFGDQVRSELLGDLFRQSYSEASFFSFSLFLSLSRSLSICLLCPFVSGGGGVSPSVLPWKCLPSIGQRREKERKKKRERER